MKIKVSRQINRGFFNLAPLLVIPTILILTVVGVFFYQSYKKSKAIKTILTDKNVGNSSIQEEPQSNLVNEDGNLSPTPTVPRQETPILTKKPTNTATPIPQSFTGTCEIIVLTSSNPNEVVLTYGLSNAGGRYMKEARWDLDNNGQWDQDFSSSNNRITINLTAGGSKTVRLQLKLSDGTLTDVCIKNVTAPTGTWVTIWGYVFSDDNCNGFRDGSESGIAGVSVRIHRTSDYSVYGTADTDGSGKYSYSTLLNGQIELTVTMTSPPGYKSHPTYVAGNYLMGYGKNTNVQINIPQVPYSSVNQCSI